jgi:putative hydrolase of the HAD superfamily
MSIELIAFDADDTLWHNEILFRGAKTKFIEILSAYVPPETAGARLDHIEVQNIDHFGYGLKSFGLSMIEAALDLTGGEIQGKDLQPILAILHDMLSNKLELLGEVSETLAQLSAAYPLMLITKGDLFEQYLKINQSGLVDFFRYVEVVANKTTNDYRRLFQKFQIDPSHVLMVGNSLRSDIQPVLSLGGRAIYIPYETTWAHEHLDPSEILPGVIEIEHFGQLVVSIQQIEEKAQT